MRTLKYVIIGLALCTSFSLSAQGNEFFHNFSLSCLDADCSAQELETAAKVLEKRLSLFGVNTITSDIRGESSSIVIRIQEEQAVEGLERLLTATGKLEFLNTYSKEDMEPHIQDAKVRDMLHMDDPTDGSSPIIGQASERDAATITTYLRKVEKRHKLRHPMTFAWSKKVNDQGMLDLYALKYENYQPVVTGSNLKTSSWTHDAQTDQYLISLTLDDSGTTSFAKATKANIGKAIAITIDQEVYAAPKVMSAITGGQLQITGDFDQTEAASLAAILGGGELPVKLRME